jgi:hypothetical protein
VPYCFESVLYQVCIIFVVDNHSTCLNDQRLCRHTLTLNIENGVYSIFILWRDYRPQDQKINFKQVQQIFSALCWGPKCYYREIGSWWYQICFHLFSCFFLVSRQSMLFYNEEELFPNGQSDWNILFDLNIFYCNSNKLIKCNIQMTDCVIYIIV